MEIKSIELGLNTFGDTTENDLGESESQAEVIRNVVEQAVLADQVGVDCFNVGEHHRADYAISAPEVVLAAIAGRTRRIRLGSAVTVLSADDPVRVFQRFSTLHALTCGRAEITLGRGWFTEPFNLFGYQTAQYDLLFAEKLDLFAQLIRRHTVTWSGQTRPKLSRQPIFPPIETGVLTTWIAVGATPESVLRAARYDMPMMVAIIGGEPKRFMPFFELYRTAFEKLGKSAQPIGVHSAGYVAETDSQAREEFWPHYKKMRDRLGIERNWPPIERGQFDVEIDRGSLYVGAPETVARKIATVVKMLGISRFTMKYSAGTLPHEHLLRSIQLYGSRTIPLVRELLA